MKTASFTLLLISILYSQFTAFSQKNDSASIFADITSSEKISLPSSFDFSKSLTILHTSGVKSKKADLKYTLRYPDSQSYMAMTISGFEGENSTSMPEVLVDFDENKMITFMSFADSKMAMIRSLNESRNGVAILHNSYSDMKNTGKTKKILGYSCEEYTFQSNGLKGNLWLTPTICEEFAQSFATLGLYLENDKAAALKGYIMRIDASDKSTGEVLNLDVKEINLKSPYSIDTKEYVTTSAPSK